MTAQFRALASSELLNVLYLPVFEYLQIMKQNMTD